MSELNTNVKGYLTSVAVLKQHYPHERCISGSRSRLIHADNFRIPSPPPYRAEHLVQIVTIGEPLGQR